MKRLLGLVVASAALLACAKSQPRTQTPAEVVVTLQQVPATPLPAPPPDDPMREWHTWSPPAIEGGPFYRVVALNVSAPSMQGGPCSLAEVEGATFLNCGSLARVDGEKIDTSFPSPGATINVIAGRYPDDLWAETYEGSYDDGYRPPPDAFSEGDTTWHHLEDGKWKKYETASSSRFAYVGQSSLFFVMPPVAYSAAIKRPKSCLDYACLHVVPGVITNGATKPDFSALKDRIAWIHHYDEGGETPEDFAFVVDPKGPVWVFMRAQDVKTGKKGFGVARWTPNGGATFDWLPSSISAKKKLSFFDGIAKDGKVEIGIAGDASTWLEGDGKTWKQSAARTPIAQSGGTPIPTDGQSFYAEGNALYERMPDGTARAVPGFDDGRYLEVKKPAEGDTWVFTWDGVYRTIRPTETLYRTETYGSLHPFPKPLGEDEECAHPFAILDATEKQRADNLRKNAWDYGALGAVELEVHDHVVIGVPVKSRAEGEELLQDHRDWGSGRLMEGAPHHVVCAPAVGAKPFVSTFVEPTGGD